MQSLGRAHRPETSSCLSQLRLLPLAHPSHHVREPRSVRAAHLEPALLGEGRGTWTHTGEACPCEWLQAASGKVRPLFSLRRFRTLWDEEVDRVGPEKASLHRVVWKFQRTRVLMDIVANILCIVMAAIGPVSGSGPSAAALSPRSPADKERHQ